MTRLDGLELAELCIDSDKSPLAGYTFVAELLWSLPRSVQQARYHVAADCEVYLTSPEGGSLHSASRRSPPRPGQSASLPHKTPGLCLNSWTSTLSATSITPPPVVEEHPTPIGAFLGRSVSSGRVPQQGHVCRPPDAVRSLPAQRQASVMHKVRSRLMFGQ
jgi:hypothetical protein